MSVFRVLRARNGDGGFIGQLGEARSGVVGFNNLLPKESIGAVGFNNSLPEASSGDGGFTVACISGCRGVIGFPVGTWPCPVRERVRPARSDGGREREKALPACSERPTIGFLWRAG